MRNNKSLVVLSLVLILSGTIITLENLNIIKGVINHWPIFPLILGLGFTLLFFSRKKTDSALMWISSFLILSSIFFYYLNFTSWKILSYLWPFFLAIIGLSFLTTGYYTNNKLLYYFSFLFIILFLSLFLVFSISISLWPLSLVILGISLLTIEYFNTKK